MKLIGNLKKQVEETKNKEEAKEIIEKAGMELTDDELDNITGGGGKQGECPDSPTGMHEGTRLITTDGAFGPRICKHCNQEF